MSNFKRYLNAYEFETVLPGSGESIKFRPITTGQIKKLLVYEGAEEPEIIEKALDEIIEGCVIKEGFSISDLYLQDRFFLLLELRKVTKGNLYQFQSVCPSCNSQSLQTVDLQKLPVKVLPRLKKEKISTKGKKVVLEEPEETKTLIGWNIIKINNNISLRMCPITRGMQIMSTELMKANFADAKPMEQAMNLSSIIFALSIQEVITPSGVEGDLSLDDKIYLLDNLTQKETEKIPDWFEKNNFGVDLKFDVLCPQCGTKVIRDIPLEDFFS